jgi:hypothetical protein
MKTTILAIALAMIADAATIHIGVSRSGIDSSRLRFKNLSLTSHNNSGPSRTTPTNTAALENRSHQKYESRMPFRSVLTSSSSLRKTSGEMSISSDLRRLRMLENLLRFMALVLVTCAGAAIVYLAVYAIKVKVKR